MCCCAVLCCVVSLAINTNHTPGAGKSTLMDILAGRKSLGHLTGQVLVNKQRRRKEQFRKVTAYVPQVRCLFCVLCVSFEWGCGVVLPSNHVCVCVLFGCVCGWRWWRSCNCSCSCI